MLLKKYVLADPEEFGELVYIALIKIALLTPQRLLLQQAIPVVRAVLLAKMELIVVKTVVAEE
tara:strand:- start:81 stop:269 length:189 start_codon:yes stop_codon:yes gene_type:complete